MYSKTLERAGWNTTVVRDVVVEDVRTLKEQPGGDLGVALLRYTRRTHWAPAGAASLRRGQE